MIICKSPFRVSFFGGGTDYEDFYQKNGSFLIGASINKFVYFSARFRPDILRSENIVSYSIEEKVADFKDIKNPLFRAVIEKYNVDNKTVDIHYFSDIPARTGLGGSSSCCCSLIYAFHKLNKLNITKKELANKAIEIERKILNEPGGIQDQIWASYGGLNTIEMKEDGGFSVKPLPVSEEFKEELSNSMILIYSGEQRKDSSVAIHKTNSLDNKKEILQISKTAYSHFTKEDISGIGKLLHRSWLEKESVSYSITTPSIRFVISKCMSLGAYGAKLLGAGGGGFVLIVADPIAKGKIMETFRDKVLNFNFENEGTSLVFQNDN